MSEKQKQVMMTILDIFLCIHVTSKIGLTGSTFFTVAISFERFFGLVFPLESRTRKRRSLICYCIPVVVLTLVVTIPNLYVELFYNWNSFGKGNCTQCTDTSTDDVSQTNSCYQLDDVTLEVISHQNWSSIHDIICTTAVPLAILIFCNGGIFWKLRSSRIQMYASRNTSAKTAMSSNANINLAVANRLVSDGPGDRPTTGGGTTCSASHSPAVSRANSKGHNNSRSSPPASSTASSERNLALVLFGIVLVFLVCHTCRIITTTHEPNQLKNIFVCQQLSDTYNVTLYPESLGEWAFVITPLSHLLLMINSSVNFLIYCAVGSRFRKELFQTRDQLRRHLSQRGNTSRGALVMPDDFPFQNGGSSRLSCRNGGGLRGSARSLGRPRSQQPLQGRSFHVGGNSSQKRTILVTQEGRGRPELSQLLSVEPTTPSFPQQFSFRRHQPDNTSLGSNRTFLDAAASKVESPESTPPQSHHKVEMN